MAWKDGQCAIHATCIDEVEELFKVVDDCVDNRKNGTMSKEELIERISEVLPNDGEISFATVTWWNGNGTFNWDTESDTELRSKYETQKNPCDDCQEFDCYGCEYAERKEE